MTDLPEKLRALPDRRTVVWQAADEIERLREALDVLSPNHEADAYYNLLGAHYDLRVWNADKICIKTIERVLEQLGRGRARVFVSTIAGVGRLPPAHRR